MWRPFPGRARGVRRIALAGALAVARVAGADPLAVRYHDGRLTVHLERVPLEEVLSAVSRETGVTIEGQPLDLRDVSKQFESLPLDQALHRLVGRQNFLLRYGTDGEPRRLELLGAPLPPPTTATRRQRAVDAVRLLLAQPPVPLPPVAAQALGGSPLPVPRLLAGLRNQNPVVRDQVAGALLGAVRGNPELLGAIRRLQPKDLAKFVSANAGGFSADVAARLQRAARDPTLKSNLSRVMMELQRQPG